MSLEKGLDFFFNENGVWEVFSKLGEDMVLK